MRIRIRAERVARLERGRGPSLALCECGEQLAAIGRAEVMIDDTGRCLYCGRPVTTCWSRFLASAERAYPNNGGVEHGSQSNS
jgi:hypothetical protein